LDIWIRKQNNKNLTRQEWKEDRVKKVNKEMKDKKRIKIKSQKRRIFKNHMKNKNHGRRQESSSEILRSKRIEKRYKRNYVQDIVRQKFRTLKLK
jgi:hypothetical protein